MNYKRREFIRLGGQLTAGLVVGSWACNSMSEGSQSTVAKPLGDFGLQLYSLRDDMPKDPKGILKQVSSFGYKQIESYDHGQLGMFWGMSPSDLKKYMDELGMVIISSHCNIDKDFEKKVDQAASIGMRYLICPWKDPQKDLDGCKKIAAQFNQCGEICKKAGIRFAYHNHDQEFKVIEGQMVQDIFMANTDVSLVDFEMDIYWVVTAGQDPEAWLKKYPNRFRLCHVKDRAKGATKREETCDLGTGSIDYTPILKTAKKNGMQYYIAEQEHYPDSTPVKSAEVDAGYMKKLTI
ncbi:MAG TPA: sugar phosphate isomerase/epimerase [Chitinophagaceae bacterium]|jgi:sugar phosphate isomerase/epimerase|nr:sugar phosphate isomerase/epimerase [Chitinophagaceae bacterium]